MKGKELIKWIQDNHAEELKIVVQYRDGGGSYYGGDNAEPCLAMVGEEVGGEYDIVYNTEMHNAVVL